MCFIFPDAHSFPFADPLAAPHLLLIIDEIRTSQITTLFLPPESYLYNTSIQPSSFIGIWGVHNANPYPAEEKQSDGTHDAPHAVVERQGWNAAKVRPIPFLFF